MEEWGEFYGDDYDCEPAPKVPSRKVYDPELLDYARVLNRAIWLRIHLWAAWDNAHPTGEEKSAEPFRWTFSEDDLELPPRPAGVGEGLVHTCPIRRVGAADVIRDKEFFSTSSRHLVEAHLLRNYAQEHGPLGPDDDPPLPESLTDWPYTAAAPYAPPPTCTCDACQWQVKRLERARQPP